MDVNWKQSRTSQIPFGFPVKENYLLCHLSGGEQSQSFQALDVWLAGMTFGVPAKPEIWWLYDYKIIIKLHLHFLFIHSALCSPCHCFLSILFSASLLRNLFRFIYSRHSNLRFDLSVSGYQLIVALNYFISDLISSCISQDTPKELCFHWLTNLFKNTCIYYVSRVNKAL